MTSRALPLSPEHRALYERLFLAADCDRRQRIEGAQAVAFFGRSGLPVPTLKQIWTLSDARQQRFLERDDFFTALRLVALAQQGHDVMALGVLERTASMQLPPPQFNEEPLDASHFGMSDADESRYQAIFHTMGRDNEGCTPLSAAMELWAKSGLSHQELEELNLLVKSAGVQPRSDQVSDAEFAVAMHLIVCRTKRATAPSMGDFGSFEAAPSSTGGGSASGSRGASFTATSSGAADGFGSVDTTTEVRSGSFEASATTPSMGDFGSFEATPSSVGASADAEVLNVVASVVVSACDEEFDFDKALQESRESSARNLKPKSALDSDFEDYERVSVSEVAKEVEDLLGVAADGDPSHTFTLEEVDQELNSTFS
ncbi:hypothetical protein P43SY_009753 [Pythium insidiosum]|uniref:EH domain-containing protein n=1 Tax=Pythium insidiosum TaxID=114742 RepID=A0AAD5QBK7_PYTIN|nr:hypothetical protein P43SY_009753 [Pythium insidiosum]